MTLDQINIRDPYILPYDGKYYMYGTRVRITEAYPTRWGEQHGFDVYISQDLKNWSEPKSVFEKNDSFWGEEEFWAPEVHIYRGKFYMLATFKAEGRCMATHILVSDTPDGFFTPVSPDPITPADWVSLDGTLYIDKKGKPHVVFCHEWKQIGNGTVCEIALSDDLTHAISAPRELWSAKDYKAVRTVRQGQECYVTDGPFLYRCKNGDLICIWSSFNEQGYAELISKSDNADIDGNWTVCDTPLTPETGGHGMIFRDFSGNPQFVMHRPNTKTLERPTITPLLEDNGVLHT